MIVDLFAGPGGWSTGLTELGLSDVGVELDAATCATRAAAGHRTIRADVAALPVGHLAGRLDGLMASPPCQSFSTAGLGEGRVLLDALCQAVRRGGWWEFSRDGGYGHVLEVGRWAEATHPGWVVCEQVPPVLPVWHAYADRWRSLGWSAWAGVLNAADYGVPQTRERAFLIARPDGRPVYPPAPTHAEGGSLTLFGPRAPWVTMEDAVGWLGQQRPARTVCGNRAPRWVYGEANGRRRGHTVALDRRAVYVNGEPTVPPVPVDRPAPTVTATAGAAGVWVWRDGDATGAFAITDALVLQGFAADYPLHGTRSEQFSQVGNAVPPPLAAAVVASAAGTGAREAAA